MPSAPSSSPEDAGNLRPNLRLDSWKEIAAYLGRGERTAKRWETERALPVHRLPGGGRGSVFAFSAELDEWLLSARAQGDPEIAVAELDEPEELPAALAATIDPDPTQPAASLAAPIRWPVWWRVPLVTLLIVSVSFAGYTLYHRPRAAQSAAAAGLVPVSSPAEKQAAHELYLKGRFEWNKRTPASLNRALDDFTQAVVHDPADAQAYVGLADTYNLLREDSLMPENEAYSRAMAASRKAVQLDDSLAEAHRSLAFVEFWGYWDFRGSAREFQRAMALDPHDPLAHLWFANAFAGPGWYAACMREIERAQELDPSSRVVLAGKGQLLINSGQAEQGIALLRQVEAGDPAFPAPHRYLANEFFAQRQYADFLAESGKQAELTGDPVLKTTTDAAQDGFAHGGAATMLQRLYEAQHQAYAAGTLSGVSLARTCVRMGKKDEALDLLRKDFTRHDAAFLWIRADLVLRELKDEPGYEELVGKLQFPAPDAGSGR